MAGRGWVLGAGLLLVAVPACAWLWQPEVAAEAGDYVHAAVDEMSRGNLGEAEDILARARNRFPEHEGVLRWSIELDRMQWRVPEALDQLAELSRAEELRTISRDEVAGMIGDLLFDLGRFAESAPYLRSGAAGDAAMQREAKATVTLTLPYIRRPLHYAAIEAELIAGPWPAMACRFGEQERACVLDTGSSMSTFGRAFAEQIGVIDVRRYGLVRDSLGRKYGAWIGVLPDLAVREVEIGPIPVLVVEDERIALWDAFGGPEHPPFGILGLDVLTRFRVELDLGQRRVVLAEPRGIEERAAETCLVVESCLVFPVQVDGVGMWFILDTAASHGSLTEEGLRMLPGGQRRLVPDYRQPKSLGGSSFVASKVTGLVLQTSAVKFTGVELPVVARDAAGRFPIHGVLGVNLLEHCRLTLDSGRLLLEQIGTKPGQGR